MLTELIRLNFEILRSITWKNVDDFVPFLTVSERELRKYVDQMKEESRGVADKNRIYHLSEKLQVSMYMSMITRISRINILRFCFR